MYFNRILTVAVILTVSFRNIVESNEETAQIQPKMLFITFRHGARAPLHIVPNYPYNSVWKEKGLGDLTNLGVRQQVANGEIIRKTYGKFIGPHYNSSEFYIQSSNSDRAVMSGQAFTTGLFPPTGNLVWRDDCLGQKWQPIPVFTTFKCTHTKDPHGVMMYQLMVEASNDQDIYSRNEEIINAIANATKVPKSVAFAFVDALICETYENATLSFGLEKYTEQLFPYADDMYNYAMKKYYPIPASGLLNDIAKRIELYNNKTSSIKTYVYSLHDVQVSGFIAAVNELVGEPEFCGTAFLELYGPSENYHTDYVIIRYRRKLTSETRAVYIKNCGYVCPYHQFVELVKKVNELNDNFLLHCT